MSDKIKVFCVDDSALIRQLLSKIVDSDQDFELVGTAPHPVAAEPKIKDLQPHVVTLDIEMPEMDGITFLKKLRLSSPNTQVIMFSSLLEKHRELCLDAVRLGAFDYVIKPGKNVQADAERITSEMIEKIHAAYRSKFGRLKRATPAPAAGGTATAGVPPTNRTLSPAGMEKNTADVMIPMPKSLGPKPSSGIIVIGSSTGGTEAIIECLKTVEKDSPPIVITQHMPELFTTTYARRLNSLLKIDVFESEDGMKVGRGQAILARGGQHTMLKYKDGGYYVSVKDGPLVTRHKPSVDVLFRSAAICAQNMAVAIILTGMGDDGARCMKELHDLGAHCIGQDEKTCVVYGMPREAAKIGALNEVLPLNKIYQAALAKVKK